MCVAVYNCGMIEKNSIFSPQIVYLLIHCKNIFIGQNKLRLYKFDDLTKSRKNFDFIHCSGLCLLQ